MIFEFSLNLVLSIVMALLLGFLLFKEIKNKKDVDLFINIVIGVIGLISAIVSFIDTGFDFKYFFNIIYSLNIIISLSFIILTIIKFLKNKKNNEENTEK